MAKSKPSRTRLERDPAACEVELGRAFGLLGKRWNGLLVAMLGPGPLGFAELRRRIGAISDSMLSDRLTELAAAGVIERRVTDTRPPGVLYGLTPAGRALLPILEQIADWAGDHLS
jgi:DNA-binding HxlR family transcriptional regulator